MTAPESVKARASLLSVVGLMYASACGGPYGMEDYVAKVGPGLFIFILVATPWVWGIPTALAAAELSTKRPVAGGYYRWVQMYLGDFWGSQAGLWSLLSSFLDNALYPVLFARVLLHLNPEMTRFEQWLAAVAFIALLSYLNFRGIQIAGSVALGLNLFLILPLFWLVGAALLRPSVNPFLPFQAPGADLMSQVGTGLALSMWLYSGYYEVSTAAEEIENPKRNIPHAIALVTPLVVLSYALPTLAGLMAYGRWESWTSGQFVTIGDSLGGPALGGWLFLGSVASYAVIFLAYLVWWSRLAWSMAAEGDLPAFLNRLHPRHGTPHRVLIAYGIVYAGMALVPFEDLLVADSWLAGAYTLLIHMALVRSRSMEPDAPGFRVPGGRVGLALNTLVPACVFVTLLLFTERDQIPLCAGLLLLAPALHGLRRGLRALARMR
jgi:amino acid transporter